MKVNRKENYNLETRFFRQGTMVYIFHNSRSLNGVLIMNNSLHFLTEEPSRGHTSLGPVTVVFELVSAVEVFCHKFITFQTRIRDVYLLSVLLSSSPDHMHGSLGESIVRPLRGYIMHKRLVQFTIRKLLN